MNLIFQDKGLDRQFKLALNLWSFGFSPLTAKIAGVC